MEPMKAYNFRFTERTIEQLEELVAYYNKSESSMTPWTAATRTDVLRYLINNEVERIRAEAQAKLESELNAELSNSKKKQGKKAVSK